MSTDKITFINDTQGNLCIFVSVNLTFDWECVRVYKRASENLEGTATNADWWIYPCYIKLKWHRL